MVEFISYDGKYPCLCMGTLTIKVDGKTYRVNHAMISGGDICKDDSWDMWAEEGDWEVDLRNYPELEPYKEEITRLVNENVEHGCCGGMTPQAVRYCRAFLKCPRTRKTPRGLMNIRSLTKYNYHYQTNETKQNHPSNTNRRKVSQ